MSPKSSKNFPFHRFGLTSVGQLLTEVLFPVVKHNHTMLLEISFCKLLLETSFYKNSMDPNKAYIDGVINPEEL
jgi:hypothetical protein